MKFFRGLRRYLAKHYMLVTFFILALSFLFYLYHQTTVDKHEVYSIDRIAEDTKGTDYVIVTYSERGDLLARIKANGLKLGVTPEGNLSGGKKAHYSTVDIQAEGHELRVSGSLIIAYPEKDTDVLRKYLVANDFNFPKDKSLGEVLTEEQNDYMKRYGKLLLVKTYSGMPVSGFFGNSIKSYYADIDESQVFNVDGSIIFVTRGWFSIDDACLFTPKK